MRSINLALTSMSVGLAAATEAAKNLGETFAKLTPDGSIPDRVCIESHSPYYWPGYRNLGVKIDGEVRRRDVVEFCVSEGWARVFVRNSVGQLKIDRERGRYLDECITGKIEPYWIDKDRKKASSEDASRLSAAEAKRRRKAIRNLDLAS